MSKPRVFFDITIGGSPAGRVVMEVNDWTIFCNIRQYKKALSDKSFGILKRKGLSVLLFILFFSINRFLTVLLTAQKRCSSQDCRFVQNLILFCFLVDCKVIDNKFNRLHETTPISQISRVAAVEFPGRARNWTNLTTNVKISHLILSETGFCRFAQKNLHQSGENFTARVVGSCCIFPDGTVNFEKPIQESLPKSRNRIPSRKIHGANLRINLDTFQSLLLTIDEIRAVFQRSD